MLLAAGQNARVKCRIAERWSSRQGDEAIRKQGLHAC